MQPRGNRQQEWGQFYTAPQVADLILGFCLRRPGDRLLDPSCGQGAFLARAARYQRWLANASPVDPSATLWGVEIDNEAASEAGRRVQAEGAQPHLVVRDFFSLAPDDLGGPFDCVVGNPPYTRSEWLDEITPEHGYKERLAQAAIAGPDGMPLADLTRRAGLHAYFLVHGSKFLRPNGRFGFVVSNSWLDVDYGVGLKAFLLDHFKIIAIIESAVERWFSEAEVNTCLVILERCDDPSGRSFNQVRFARFRRPLSTFISLSPDDPGRAVEVESLIMRLMPPRTRLEGDVSVRVVPQGGLQPERKWGPYLRAPEIFFQTREASRTVSLGEVARPWRGLTTGANRFFYLDPDQVAQWEIEPEYTRPLLKSPREITHIRVPLEALSQRVLMIPREHPSLAGTNVGRYLEWGKRQGYHQRPTCGRRPLWYSLPAQPALDDREERLVWVKGVWNRHFVPLLQPSVVIDQQFYGLTVEPGLAESLAALLNSSWAALQTELLGRSNFGEGVLWLAGYEVQRLRLPDPRQLLAADHQALHEALAAVAAEPVVPLTEAIARPAQQRLDAIVFDLLGLVPTERMAVVQAAAELTDTRIARARADRPTEPG